ncbi:MAG TPA: phosphate acetyltransferase [Candidatus Cloacimonadota bacterium]|nr:phosphate acetyltransferase [Candidatus Cloacimonadota bacterium]HPS37876.1 phosphate acetyltransferase [Candidatus Cloacimonadota bacterium]
MDIISDLKQRARATNGTIVLPESGDTRMLEAAQLIVSEKIAKVILLGNPTQIQSDAQRLGVDLSGVTFIDPENYSGIGEFSQFFYNKRKEKGVTQEDADKIVRQPLFFGALLVKFGLASGMVAGAANTTADVLRAALQVVGVKAGLKTVSSTFIMVLPDFMGEEKVMLFADCAVVPLPDASQLADIAMSTAETRRAILGDEPMVAMLSFSTKGSAEHELVTKVRDAMEIMKQRGTDFVFDGEMQLDAAIVPKVGASKAPGSPVAGQANVLIFPDLQSGNIGYKIAQRIGKAEAIGPIIQGLAAPVCDLSRGCSTQDIVGTAVLVLLMASNNK